MSRHLSSHALFRLEEPALITNERRSSFLSEVHGELTLCIINSILLYSLSSCNGGLEQTLQLCSLIQNDDSIELVVIKLLECRYLKWELLQCGGFGKADAR